MAVSAVPRSLPAAVSVPVPQKKKKKKKKKRVAHRRVRLPNFQAAFSVGGPFGLGASPEWSAPFVECGVSEWGGFVDGFRRRIREAAYLDCAKEGVFVVRGRRLFRLRGSVVFAVWVGMRRLRIRRLRVMGYRRQMRGRRVGSAALGAVVPRWDFCAVDKAALDPGGAQSGDRFKQCLGDAVARPLLDLLATLLLSSALAFFVSCLSRRRQCWPREGGALQGALFYRS